MTVTVKKVLIRWYGNVILYGHALCIMFPLTVRNLKMEKPVTTEFCVKLGNNLTDRHDMLQIPYWDTILHQAQLFQVFRHIQDSREDAKDDLSSEQRKMTSNCDWSEEVCTLLARKC